MPTTKTLNQKSDSYLVRMIKNKADDDAFKEVCRRYENVFYKVCHRYDNPLLISGINPQDIYDEKNFILFHCVSSFKPEKKAKLGTWIGNYARYLCLNSINSKKFIIPTENIKMQKYIEDNQAKVQHTSGGREQEENFKYIFNILSQMKDKRILELFKIRYFDDKKMIWAKVAKKMGISTQTAMNLHNQGIKILRLKLKSKNISDII